MRFLVSVSVMCLAAMTAAPGFSASKAGVGISAEEAYQRLMEGNARFVAGKSAHPDQSAARVAELESGQHPFAVVLGCADSRVSPEVIFDQGLGDLFVLRVAGNVPDDEMTGSIEYAVEHLGAKLVMVLGHEKCGAVQATVQGGEVPGHLPSIVGRIKPSVAEAKALPGDVVSNCVRINVQHVVTELRGSEPILKELVETGKLKIVGARYDLHTGKVIPVKD